MFVFALKYLQRFKTILRLWPGTLTFTVLALLLMGSLITACLDLERSTPTKRSFHLDIKPPAEKFPRQHAVLKIRRLGIEPLYAGRNLVYRVGKVEYESDYYSEFLIPPATEIHSLVRSYLDQCGLFAQVTSTSSQLNAAYVLEGNIHTLVGDYQSEPHQAVLEIEFTILSADDHQLLFSKRYKESQTLTDREPTTLVEGLSGALQKILQQLARDLRGLKKQAPL